MTDEETFLAEMASFDTGSLAAMIGPLEHQIARLQRRLDRVRLILGLDPSS